ncbi:MAG: endopeptidase La [Holosporales bacterium]|jgi:ATP-dependent Lon protease|nr:endopeptidase La [Holosporales bacterium]
MTKKAVEVVQFPLVALRDVVVFPVAVVPLFIGRHKSVNAIEMALMNDKCVVFATQNDPTKDIVRECDLYKLGTVCYIDQTVTLTDGTIKILVTGLYRAKIVGVKDTDDIMLGDTIEAKTVQSNNNQIDGLKLALQSNFESFFKKNKNVPTDVWATISSIDDPSKLCDMIASYLPLKVSERQSILETLSVRKRLEKLIYLMEEKSELVTVEKKIKNRVKRQVEKNQKEYYLNEQLKAIYRELGDVEDANQEIKTLESQIKNSEMASEAKEKALHEVKKLKNMPTMSQEGGIIRTYIDWLLGIPWMSSTEESTIKEAEEILEKSHHGLEKVKERIMEYLAVQKRVNKMKAQIMCFVGPPGVGKTSLGKAIADATKKSFVRVALGGVNDEAEIRGHRRTYIGAMPGKIIQAMKKAKTSNPVFLLDEIDKMGVDWRGDPASALLEVLDPEQNHAFVDHYLEIPYDLSGVMFITTANTLDIQHALLDRMEVINLSGYTEEEKLNIAKAHIIPKQLELNGLKGNELEIKDSAVVKIVKNYTMESGVRNLERAIAKISRKAVRKIVSGDDVSEVTVDVDNVSDFLGAEKHKHTKAGQTPKVGVVTGLAWTESGGDILAIEVLLVPGSGAIISTGQLGEVMQESIKASYSYIKSQCDRFNLDKDEFAKLDVHVHVPEGAVPKDGPSAGITACVAIASAFTNRAVRADIAMTGEITLTGKILAIGGLKEKLLAARRNGIKNIFIPKENEDDVKELPKVIVDDVTIKCVGNISEVLAEVFSDPMCSMKPYSSTQLRN